MGRYRFIFIFIFSFSFFHFHPLIFIFSFSLFLIFSSLCNLMSLSFFSPPNRPSVNGGLLSSEKSKLVPFTPSKTDKETSLEYGATGGSRSASKLGSGAWRQPHCHLPIPAGREAKAKAKIQLIVVSILCLLFMLLEIAGNTITNHN